MKVTLRERNQGGKTSLYLDYYHKGKRKLEYLKLYLNPNAKTKEEKDLNKKTMQLAESVRAKRQIEIQNGVYGFRDAEKMKGSALDYIKSIADKKQDSKGNQGNWISMYKHLEKFTNGSLSFEELDRDFVEDFKKYLGGAETKSKGVKLSQNSKYSYFNKFKAALKQAVKDRILPTNPGEGVDGFKQGEPQREYLSLEELKKVAKTDCEIPVLKNAFLFSALSGLRWSDVQKLEWSEVQYSDELGHHIRFIQKKTKGAETLPISEQAVSLMGERGNPDERVFTNLRYSAWYNLKLQQWMLAAGIHRTITFHCARHTYATLQLAAGTDIYTVSKLLGHRELRTTQIYAKVIDSKKIEAANKINLDL